MPKIDWKIMKIIEMTNRFLVSFPKLSAFFAGTLLKFCFCKETTFPILIFPVFAILLCVLRMSSRKKSFSIGYCFGMGYFSSTLYWIAESFKCVGFRNYGYIAVLFLVLYISLYPAIACWLTKKFATTRLNFLLFFSIFWVLAEYLRGIIFTGFPWNLIGYIAYDIPYFSQIADIFGIYGVSFLLILVTSLLTTKKTTIYGLSLLILTIFYGYYKVNFFNEHIESKNQNSITLVQPSISQEDKINVEKFKENLDRHIKLSNESKIYSGKKLIIWPEAAINIPLKSQSDILQYVASSIKNDKSYIITGCDRFDEEKKLYNSIYVFGKDAKVNQIYDKRHLLPFGEFIPEFLLDLGLKKLTVGLINFSNGNLSRTMKIDGFHSFEAVICYEIAFPGEIVDNNESSWILNITNDSWFKDSDGPTQHLKTVSFRAIEEGKSIVRCANNGISCIIDCNGRISDILQTDEIGKIDSQMPGKQQSTIFSQYKNSTILCFLSIFLISLIVRRKRKINFKEIF